MKNLKITCMIMAALFGIAIIFGSCKEKDNPNSSPTISGVTVNPPSVSANGTVTVSVSASDPDGDNLTYSYTVNGGAINGNGATAIWTAPSVAGAYSVNVSVSDGKDGSVSGSGSLTVTEVVTQTKVTGTASFPAGTSGDLANAKVSLYTSYENWNANQPIKFATTIGSGASVTFELTDVLPGNYYLDIWKDNDNNAIWSSNDFVGWYGSGGLGSPSLTEFQITEGQTFNCSIDMYIIAKGDKLPK